jgi:hypothetical protein
MPGPEQYENKRPKFDKRSVFAGLIIWGVAALCWVPLFVYGELHPAVLGEKDMGGAFIAAFTIFGSGIVFLGGVLAMILGLLRYVWLMWWHTRVRQVREAKNLAPEKS